MPFTNDLQNTLLKLAQDSIVHGLRTGQALQPVLTDFPDSLRQKQASFVTLERHGQLRGCIGMLEAVRPLALDVAENAFAAAFRDPRFPPLRDSELFGLQLHISILSPSEAIHFESESDLVAQLQPNIDGLILQEGLHRGTFLPSVWEQLPESKDFLRHLKQKAGLPAEYWSNSLQVWRYRTEIFGTSFVPH